MIKLPKKLEANLKTVFSDKEILDLSKAIQDNPSLSYRLNPNKKAKLSYPTSKVPWSSDGEYIELSKKPKFGQDPIWLSGGYYVQDSASMVIEQLVDWDKDQDVLDLCASPGGKTLLVRDKLSTKSFLLANEVVSKRARTLISNLDIWGDNRTIVCQNQPSEIAERLPGFFDLVLIDAPCSGEGLIRKDPYLYNHWKWHWVLGCQTRQSEILESASRLVKPGGRIIYSTCTFNTLENENIIKTFTEQNRDFRPIRFNFSDQWGITEKEFGYYRFYPPKTRSEGFFVCVLEKDSGLDTISYKSKIKKVKTPQEFKDLSNKEYQVLSKYFTSPGDYQFWKLNQKIYALLKPVSKSLFLRQKLRVHRLGVFVGVFKQSSFIPSKELAWSSMLNPSVPEIELDLEQTNNYIQQKPIQIPQNQFEEGWVLVVYGGVRVGWLKKTRQEYKNYYQKNILSQKTKD